MPPPLIYNIEEFDFDNPLYDINDIRRVNPQRHEMEQLTAVVDIDATGRRALGFKDVTDEEFWVAGHMPGFPLMPGVILCECAAQLAAFYARKETLLGGDYLGFGGMTDVRFRRPVFPGCRLILMTGVTKVRPNRRVEFDFQGLVDQRVVFGGTMIGVPINRDETIG